MNSGIFHSAGFSQPYKWRLAGMAAVLFSLPLGQAKLFAQYAQPGIGYQQALPSGYGSGGYAPDYPQQQYPSPYSQQPAYGQQAPAAYPQQTQQALGPDQLEQMAAPIALYPDQLVALILAASTYPQQVAAADQWLRSAGNVSPDQIVAGAGAQNWDPSVKALTAFPQVLAVMDQNLQWTTVLGNTYFNQPQDVLQAVQVMRQRAQGAGNLQSTPQEAVSYNQGYIQIAPANPQVVYVPMYNPWAVYGQPVSPYPGFSLLGALSSVGSFLGSVAGGFGGGGYGSSPVSFGLGMVMSAFSNTPWGLLSWGLNWLTQGLFFHQSNYYTSSRTVRDWGLPHGGPRAYGYRGPGVYGQRGYAMQASYSRSQMQNYNRGSLQTYNRGNYGSGFYNRPGQTYGQGYGQGYGRMTTPARPQQMYSRPNFPSAYNGSGFGSSSAYRYGATNNSGFGNGFRSSFGNRPVAQQNYRASAEGFGGFGQRGSSGFGGSSFKEPHASSGGGFHMFGGGGGHSSESFHAPKSFGGGHSGGGGGFHMSSHGGGGHSGGGHSGGGHHH